MSEKPLCGYCYNECTDDCCDKRRIDVLESQLDKAREEEKRLKELGLEAFKLGFELGLNNETYELHRSLEEKEEELLNYKVKYNNQCSEMNRLKQSRKDQLAMIRKLKEKG